MPVKFTQSNETAPEASRDAGPDPFLEVRIQDLCSDPALVGMCAGYEDNRWRSKELADHMMEWLPEFALSYSERKSIGPGTAVRLMRAAARSIYKSKKYQNRGEFGELLLHIAMRQAFKTIPAISKIYYKDSDNITVKGFDAVHVIAAGDQLELWIGESKFYDDISRAIADVVKELHAHTQADYLRSEFAAIINKIDPEWPHAARLKNLLHPNTSLDKVFDRACVPVLLTYDSKTVNEYDKVSNQYVQAFTTEVTKHHSTFRSKNLPAIRICLFLMPLKSKAELVIRLDEVLKKWQHI